MRNNLGTSQSPYYALASWSEVVESEAFIDRMAAGRTTISKTDILAVFQLAREELARLLSEGCYVTVAVRDRLNDWTPRLFPRGESLNTVFQPWFESRKVRPRFEPSSMVVVAGMVSRVEMNAKVRRP